jgi:hypothetical protein
MPCIATCRRAEFIVTNIADKPWFGSPMNQPMAPSKLNAQVALQVKSRSPVRHAAFGDGEVAQKTRRKTASTRPDGMPMSSVNQGASSASIKVRSSAREGGWRA